MNRLREIRVVRRVSQFDLRLLTGINQSKLSMIENGLMPASEEEKKRIASAFGLPVSEIWFENEKKETGA
ncbi:MAG: helix-turn-helix transcriptional regulator [Deltaproteobacteria bacterium]|nr:helix-turn-helix transcriptional regulator [Deltaproteobacteria bacterium]